MSGRLYQVENDTVTLKNKNTGEVVTLRRKTPTTEQSSPQPSTNPMIDMLKGVGKTALATLPQMGQPLEPATQIFRGMTEASGQIRERAKEATGFKTPLISDILLDPMTYVGGGVMKQSKLKIPFKIHGEQWIDDAAAKTREVATGLDDALKNAYSEAYEPFKNTPVDNIKIGNILSENNVPENLITEVYQKIGDIDTIGKAHNALQIIRRGINDYVWSGQTSGMGGAFNPKIAAKNVWGAVKEEIRKGIGSVDKKSEESLRNLDKLSSSDIYERIDDLFDMVGKSGRIDTSGIYTLMKSGLGGTSKRKVIKETEQRATELGKYIKSPEFSKELKNVITKAKEVTSELKSFRTRQFQKGAASIASTVAGTGGAVYFLNKLFGGSR
jgi:hypothetical protein